MCSSTFDRKRKMEMGQNSERFRFFLGKGIIWASFNCQTKELTSKEKLKTMSKDREKFKECEANHTGTDHHQYHYCQHQ